MIRAAINARNPSFVGGILSLKNPVIIESLPEFTHIDFGLNDLGLFAPSLEGVESYRKDQEEEEHSKAYARRPKSK